MRKIEYVVAPTRADEPFVVSSYSLTSQGGILAEHCPPIKMSIAQCLNSTSQGNLAHITKLDTVVDPDFARHHIDVVMGAATSWKLVQFQVTANCLRLEYYHPATGRFEYLTLDLRDSQITNLVLAFSVPHLDARPATEYTVSMDYAASVCGAPRSSIIIVEERLPSGDCNIFTFNSQHPDEITLTAYTDL